MGIMKNAYMEAEYGWNSVKEGDVEGVIQATSPDRGS